MQIKCVRSEGPDEPDPPAPCNGCKSIGLECTYLHVYKRPGRPNSWMTGQAGANKRKAWEEAGGVGEGKEGPPAVRRKKAVAAGMTSNGAAGKKEGKGAAGSGRRPSTVNAVSSGNGHSGSGHFVTPGDTKPVISNGGPNNGNLHSTYRPAMNGGGDYNNMLNIGSNESNGFPTTPDMWNAASNSPARRPSHGHSYSSHSHGHATVQPGDAGYNGSTLAPNGMGMPSGAMNGRYDAFAGAPYHGGMRHSIVGPSVGNIIHSGLGGIGIGLPAGSSNGFAGHPAAGVSPQDTTVDGLGINLVGAGGNATLVGNDPTSTSTGYHYSPQYRAGSASIHGQYPIPSGNISNHGLPVASEHSGFSPSSTNMAVNGHTGPPNTVHFQETSTGPQTTQNSSEANPRGRHGSMHGMRSSIPPSRLLHESLQTMPQIEDVTSWSTVSFFISLYLRHLHALVSTSSACEQSSEADMTASRSHRLRSFISPTLRSV